jgi:hypothetical protein
MARKPLRSQLNQIRAWVRQGRTDAWIAHQLEVPAAELREFRRRHELSAEDDDGGDVELRDEIEAEIEAATLQEEEEAVQEESAESDDEPKGEDAEAEDGKPEGAPRRRRRRRRRGGATRPGAAMQATFDHGSDDGFGLWLDPSVEDDPIYAEHWAGHRKVEVTIEPERIVIRRV